MNVHSHKERLRKCQNSGIYERLMGNSAERHRRALRTATTSQKPTRHVRGALYREETARPVKRPGDEQHTPSSLPDFSRQSRLALHGLAQLNEMAGTSPAITNEYSPFESIRTHAARLDRHRPLLDLALHELTEILRRHLLRRRDLRAHGLQALAHRRGLGRLDDRGVELLHDRLRRALGQEHSAPRVGFQVLHALLGG